MPFPVAGQVGNEVSEVVGFAGLPVAACPKGGGESNSPSLFRQRIGTPAITRQPLGRVGNSSPCAYPAAGEEGVLLSPARTRVGPESFRRK
jgi:hypothetical protein